MLLILACAPSPPTPASVPAWGTAAWEGEVPNGGFGARLASDGERAWIGAPFACAVYAVEPGGRPSPFFEGAPASFCGAGLGAGVVGAPAGGDDGEGAVYVNGAAVATGSNIGGVVVGDATSWVASTAWGWRDSDGHDGVLGTRPDALVLLDGEVVAGAAFGGVATWRGTIPELRAADDQRGYALAACDADGDGDVELVVGAPGTGTLDSEGVTVQHGSGRFGAALACGEPGVVYVGAPAEGELHQGAVYRVERLGTPTLVATGRELDELGSALAVASGHLLVGAPGPAASPGSVRVVPLP